MFSIRRPTVEAIADFLQRQADKPFSYPEVGALERESPPPGYVFDCRQFCLGVGEAVFASARAAIERWRMFDLGWVEAISPHGKPRVGDIVAVLARVPPLWSLNACRIIAVFDGPPPQRRFGFSYGTLAEHAERGEERFSVEWRADDSVWYDLRAFSRPAHWLARLGYPWARRMQKRFGVDSCAAMQRYVVSQGGGERSGHGDG